MPLRRAQLRRTTRKGFAQTSRKGFSRSSNRASGTGRRTTGDAPVGGSFFSGSPSRRARMILVALSSGRHAALFWCYCVQG